MTIGIAAIGPRAGTAVLCALELAERVGQGAIGGFVSYAALSADGRCLRDGTQRGGSAALPLLHKPGAEALAAPRAALMSSAPHRPEPLSQFVLASRNACLVTGHRLPNARRGGEPPINERVLGRLDAGEPAQRAVRCELASDPDADAGIIALDREGRLFVGNTSRVERRPDLGQAVLYGTGGSAVAVLHNAIAPVRGLAELVAQAALDLMENNWTTQGMIEVDAGTPVQLGTEEAVFLESGSSRVAWVQTTDPAIRQAHFHGAAVYQGAVVYRNGQRLGYVLDEPYVVVEHSRVVSLDGRGHISLGYRTQPLTFQARALGFDPSAGA